ncbi:MAG: cation-efflux pump, partial [Methylobacterium sp.]|nr:cation-efflux pump [Methylobacterium sp.]
LHELRTRRMAHRALVDAHILVNPRISVSEGHNIAERARNRVLQSHPAVMNVLVHVDPEEDTEQDTSVRSLPERSVLMQALEPLLEGLPRPERITFHYLGGKVEAEVFLPHDGMDASVTLADAEKRVADRLAGNPYFSAISLNLLVRPAG